MKKIQKNLENEIIIDKSRFITRLFRVNTLDDIEYHLTATRKMHADANHNCYAYIIGEHQEIMKASDDGEPQKTAGMPMLDALKKNDLTDILAITTRYFGGIKLGAGGLIRAYSKSVSTALSNATFVVSVPLETLQLTYPYDEVKHVLMHIKEKSTLLDVSYDAFVHYKVAIKETDTKEFLSHLRDLNRGNLTCHSLGVALADFVIETGSKDE